MRKLKGIIAEVQPSVPFIDEPSACAYLAT